MSTLYVDVNPAAREVNNAARNEAEAALRVINAQREALKKEKSPDKNHDALRAMRKSANKLEEKIAALKAEKFEYFLDPVAALAELKEFAANFDTGHEAAVKLFLGYFAAKPADTLAWYSEKVVRTERMEELKKSLIQAVSDAESLMGFQKALEGFLARLTEECLRNARNGTASSSAFANAAKAAVLAGEAQMLEDLRWHLTTYVKEYVRATVATAAVRHAYENAAANAVEVVAEPVAALVE